MCQDQGRIFCREINKLKIHQLYRGKKDAGYFGGGPIFFRPRSSPAWICDRCSLKILDSQWFLVRTRERYSLLRRSLKPKKSTFWNFLEFCRWKVWFQQGSTPAEAQQPFFFLSLSLRFLKEWWDFRSFRKGVYSPSRELILVLIMSEEYLLCKYKCTKTLSGMASLLFKWPCT